ncbi:hypothetical protein V4U86_02875 [Mycobacterium sp. AMU20-3851]|uniref:hypothetical protein n=1 Tax=Mycobacterium sp. AMU20-3851 TaxID=3122055 RepID=UPI00375403FF
MSTAPAKVVDRPTCGSNGQDSTVTTEGVATVVAGIAQIGAACDALKRAGHHASIAGNRILIDDQVYAQFVGAGAGKYGRTAATWMIYHVAGTPPAWIVGAEPLVGLPQ